MNLICCSVCRSSLVLLCQSLLMLFSTFTFFYYAVLWLLCFMTPLFYDFVFFFFRFSFSHVSMFLLLFSTYISGLILLCFLMTISLCFLYIFVHILNTFITMTDSTPIDIMIVHNFIVLSVSIIVSKLFPFQFGTCSCIVFNVFDAFREFIVPLDICNGVAVLFDVVVKFIFILFWIFFTFIDIVTRTIFAIFLLKFVLFVVVIVTLCVSALCWTLLLYFMTVFLWCSFFFLWLCFGHVRYRSDECFYI